MRPGFIFTMRDRNSNLYERTKENAEDEVEINKKILTRHWSSTYDLIDGFVVELIATFFICFLSKMVSCVSLYSCLTSATEIPQVNGDTHAFMSSNTFIPIKPMTNQKLQWAGDMRPGFIFTMRDRNSNLIFIFTH